MIRCCKDCERKGCGAYHDICPKYLAEKELVEKRKCQDGVTKMMNEYHSDLSIRLTKIMMNKRRK